MRENSWHDKDLFSREHNIKLKELRDNEQVTVRTSNKSNSIVIMDRSNYLNKLSSIVGDEQKFSKLTKDSTEALKKKLNGLIETSNMPTNEFIITNWSVTISQVISMEILKRTKTLKTHS